MDPSLGGPPAVNVTYLASDSEWRVTQEWRSIKVFSHNSLYINRVFLLSLSSLSHRIYTRFSPKYYSNSRCRTAPHPRYHPRYHPHDLYPSYVPPYTEDYYYMKVVLGIIDLSSIALLVLNDSSIAGYN